MAALGGYRPGTPSARAFAANNPTARYQYQPGGPVGQPWAAPDRVLCLNSRGRWVPAIPEPFYAWGRKRCHCGDAFWTQRGYRGHYALHLLDGTVPP